MSCGVIYDLSLLSLSRIFNFNKIRSWSVEILAMHTSSLCASTHIVIFAIINELRSYFRFVIVVTKQDFKFEKNPFMDTGDIGYSHKLSMCVHAHCHCCHY